MGTECNLNPVVDVPCRPEAQRAFRVARESYPWLQVKSAGGGTHTGRDTSWSGAYDSYELVDPLSPDFGMTGRVADAASEIAAKISEAVAGNRNGGQWW